MGMTKLFLVTISNGGTNYSLTAQALAEMTDEVVLTMGYVVGLLYAVAALLAIYNATVIYIKLQAGEVVELLAVYLDGRVHRRDLLDLAEKARQRRAHLVLRDGHGTLFECFAGRILRVGHKAEL